MKKIFFSILALIISLVVLTGCKNNSASKELNLFTWEGMFPQEVLDGFEKETGIKINYSNFDSDESMLGKLEATNGGDYDLVIADDYIIQTVIEQGLAQKLDKTKISNWNNINEIYQGQFYDKADEYTVPYGSGVQTIIYNPEKIDFEIKGYKDLWNEKLKDDLSLIGNYRVINGMALKILGESYNTEDIEVINKASEQLLDLAPNIRVINDDNAQDNLISGEVNVGVMYTSQVTLALLANPNFKIVYPEEGIGFGIMANFIPSKAPNPDAAHKFIDYILKADIGAKCFENLGYYSTNKESDKLISDEMKTLITLPDEIESSQFEMIKPISNDAEEAHIQGWTTFKSATGQ